MTVEYCTTLAGGQGRMNQKYLTSDRFQVTALPMKEPTGCLWALGALGLMCGRFTILGAGRGRANQKNLLGDRL